MDTAKKEKTSSSFFRACRYVGPHRGILAISIGCARVVGLAFTGGLGTMLPIMQVLINGDTVPDWVNRKIVEQRLDVKLVDDVNQVRLAKVHPGGAAARQNLQALQSFWPVGDARDRAVVTRILAQLSDPDIRSAKLVIDDHAAELGLPAVTKGLALGRKFSNLVSPEPIKAIGAIMGVLVGLAIFGNIVRFFQQYLSEKAAVLAVRDIRHQLYDHTLHLHLSFFGQKGTSDVTSRLTQDAQSLQEGMKQILGQSIQEPIKAGLVLGLALFISWPLTIFICLFAPVMGVLIRKFGKKVRRAAKAALQKSSTMLGQVEGSLSGIRVVKGANAERDERRRFRNIADNLVNEQLRIARLDAFNTPMLELLTLIVVCVIVVCACYMVLVLKTIEPSTFFLVMVCLVGIGDSLRRMSKINTILQKSNAAAARLFEMIDLPVERPRHRDAMGGPALHLERPRIVLPVIQKEIRFKDVTFTYAGANGPAVQNVSLTVPKGTSIAIVGRNGSGKTTLLALLPRFFDPQEGRITIDGADIRDVTLTSLRRQIGIVTQDSVIFPGTIAENIAYAMPLAKREQVIDAAQRAFAHEFILEKPQGYDTVLGEHGAQLSGGQKQRLCIARAILRATPILILDEATSQVDAESEHLIQQAIESLMHERTTFVIAHRFSTILSADTIVVMDRADRGGGVASMAACQLSYLPTAL